MPLPQPPDQNDCEKAEADAKSGSTDDEGWRGPKLPLVDAVTIADIAPSTGGCQADAARDEDVGKDLDEDRAGLLVHGQEPGGSEAQRNRRNPGPQPGEEGALVR